MHILHKLNRIGITLFFVKGGPVCAGGHPHARVLARSSHCRGLDSVENPVVFILDGRFGDGFAI